ncbi:hypothetical protein [Rhodohalobacter barkolensis]|uniref:Uncharacterized protein n=1 Tax=Rhodohalobacter barkolensis TaxID=2053187 RepID=A0A2N0VLM4_9BACT|nr:hypothetical protein [Rhodohalobacter barkolensis]PKD45082.1 hypothetical protein CWD77_06400 [Rhodohalobacter barkolensis]
MTEKESKRGMKVIGVTLIIFAILVAPHEGEFWPFSIYPMFSQAGNPWTRAMILDVTDYSEEEIWQQRTNEDFIGDPVAVRQYGVDEIDFSNYVSKTENWTDRRREAIRRMFGLHTFEENRWLVVKANGYLAGEDSVAVDIIPWILLTSEGTELNPNIDNSEYMSGGER